MFPISDVLGFALAVFLTYCAYIIFEKGHQARTARRWGCKPLRSEIPWDLFGLRSFREFIAARRLRKLPVHMMKAMDNVGVNAHTMYSRFLLNPYITTRDPENLKSILSTQSSQWELGASRGDLLAAVMGRNLVTHEAEAWKISRALFRPQFYLSQISNTAMFERHLRDFCCKIPIDGNGWSPELDLLPLFRYLTLDVATEFLLGYSVHSQNPSARSKLPKVKNQDYPNLDIFVIAISDAADWSSELWLLGKWSRLIYSHRFNHNVKAIFNVFNWFAHDIIQPKSDQDVTSDETSKHQYFVLKELSNLTQDPNVLRDETGGLVIAASSTTSVLLSWTMFYLSRDPGRYKKLRNAVNDGIGLDPDTPISDISQLRSCTYLQNCLSEALRLGSPTPITSRVASNDTTLPTGGGQDGTAPVFVPKGMMVVMNMFSIHHRSDLFGEDVELFNPERWENRGKGWDMSPFGGGPRACVGRASVSIISFSSANIKSSRAICDGSDILYDCTYSPAV